MQDCALHGQVVFRRGRMLAASIRCFKGPMQELSSCACRGGAAEVSR